MARFYGTLKNLSRPNRHSTCCGHAGLIATASDHRGTIQVTLTPDPDRPERSRFSIHHNGTPISHGFLGEEAATCTTSS